MGFPGGSDGKASAYNAGDLGSIPGQGRSAGEGNGNPVQYSCLENCMDGGTWQATSPWGHKKLDTTEQLHFTSLLALDSGPGKLWETSLWTSHRIYLFDEHKQEQYF